MPNAYFTGAQDDIRSASRTLSAFVRGHPRIILIPQKVDKSQATSGSLAGGAQGAGVSLGAGVCAGRSPAPGACNKDIISTRAST